MGACYPCPAVDRCLDCPVHYKGSPRESFISVSMPWSCPGGSEPPVNCISKNFEQSADGSRCACKPGMYPVNMDCLPCLAGHMCPNGTLVTCPMHYHQPATMATSCLLCATTGDRNGFFNGCPRGKLLQFCDPVNPESQSRALSQNCLPCNQCKRAYTNDIPMQDQYECYRDG